MRRAKKHREQCDQREHFARVIENPQLQQVQGVRKSVQYHDSVP